MAGHSKSEEHVDTFRMFVAIALPDTVRQAMEKTQDELRDGLPVMPVRWARPDQFHLTMRFLGSVDVRQVDSLNESVRRACGGFGDLQLRAAGLGVFPGPRRPRVVWAGITDRGDRLAALYRAIEAATAQFTNEAPQETFVGHVTLARCRDLDRRGSAALAALVNRLANRSFGDWTASTVEVMRSQTLPSGSRYTTLATITLDQPSA